MRKSPFFYRLRHNSHILYMLLTLNWKLSGRVGWTEVLPNWVSLRDVYSEEALKKRQFRNCFDKFRSGDFSLKDEQRSGRPSGDDDDQIQFIVTS